MNRKMTDREHALEAFNLYKDWYLGKYNTARTQEDYERAREIWSILEEIQQAELAIYAFFEGRG